MLLAAVYKPETLASVRKKYTQLEVTPWDFKRVASTAIMVGLLCQRDACFLLLRHESEFVLPARSIYIHKSILQH